MIRLVILRFSVCLVLLATLAGCGFQLRGRTTLPFETLYVPGNTSLAVELKRNIAAGTQTKLVDTPEQAEARMQIPSETREKVILSLDTAGRVREYQLRGKVSFRVVDARGLEYLPLNNILLTRDVSFNDEEVLAKESEEALLYRNMQTDMVQQILRRLSVAARAPQESPAPGASSAGSSTAPAGAPVLAPQAAPGQAAPAAPASAPSVAPAQSPSTGPVAPVIP
jgi:LPS-assembly lipoprotein